MTYSPDTPIIHAPTGTLAEALGWLDIKAGPETEYATELWRLCTLVDIDPAVLFAQASHETGDFSSYWWQYRRNPAGIGITGDKKQNEASQSWANGVDAARGHFMHMSAYVFGAMPLNVRFSQFREWITYDDRFDDVYNEPWAGDIRTLSDLTGKWAVDPKYAEKVAAKANSIFPNRPQEVTPVSNELVFGGVLYPQVVESHLDSDNSYIKTSGAPDTPEGIVWHRMLGTWGGTNGWFHGGNGATAYGVAVAATDGDAAAGKIYEWIKPRTGWYGESSGPVDEPYGDGLALVQKVGALSVNRTTKAIEISGFYDTPLDEKARAAIVNLTAYWADQKRIPWNEFPIIPGTDRSFVIWHQEITIGSGKVCPGTVVMNETSALIERVRNVLKQAQAGARPSKPTGYTPSVLPEWWDESLTQVHPTDKRVGDKRYWAMRRSFVCHTLTTRRSSPDPTAPVSGPKVQVREKVFGERQVDDDFVLTVDGHYIPASKLSPRVKLRN